MRGRGAHLLPTVWGGGAQRRRGSTAFRRGTLRHYWRRDAPAPRTHDSPGMLGACSTQSTAQNSPTPSLSQTQNPAGMTLDEEVSAVIVAGFQDPLTAPIAADFKQRQFGG